MPISILFFLLLSFEWINYSSYIATVNAAIPKPPLGYYHRQQQGQGYHRKVRNRDHQHRDYYAIKIELPRRIQQYQQQQQPVSSPVRTSDEQDDDQVINGDLYHHYHHHHHRPQQHPENHQTVTEIERWIEECVDRAHAVGRLLGLEFESRVGSLPDYFLFSRPRPPPSSSSLWSSSSSSPNHHDQNHLLKSNVIEPYCDGQAGLAKRSVLSDESIMATIEEIEEGAGGEGLMDQDEGGTTASPSEAQERWRASETDELDPIVERFHALRTQYTSHSDASNDQSSSSTLYTKRDTTYSTVQIMKSIHRQELRWRVKKRAPLPDPLPPHIVPEIQGDQGGKTAKGKTTKEKEEKPSKVTSSTTDKVDEQQIDEEDEVEDIVFEDESEEVDEQSEEPSLSSSLANGAIAQKGVEDSEPKAAPLPPSSVENETSENQSHGEELQPDDGVAKHLNITDPGFKYQWHLHNTVNEHDINVTGVWEQGINGTGVNVAIIDDGLDANSKDLSENYFAEGSWDFNDHTATPLPRLSDDLHGTRCAGEIAAARNDVCGVGVAYGAKVAGIRILSGQITDVDEAAALNYQFQENHIYSCSWGPPDDGRSMDGPKGVVMDAFVNGVTNGRGGKGSIFVFATGNGGRYGDDCNFDGYTNSPYTVSIGAIDRHGRHPYYSEACSAQLAVTYSNGGGSAIYTCDVGEHKCFAQHGGTSAAAPIAAGMITLALSVRPDLSWRDVQALLVQTARPVSTDDPDWKPTAAGRLFNHKFGYGRLDAYALVEAAKTFKNLKPQVYLDSPIIVVQQEIPQDDVGVTSTYEVRSAHLGDGKAAELSKLEHITVTVNIAHDRRGDVEVTLISPLGIESHLGVPRPLDQSKDGFVDWTFMTVKHWEEDIMGTWTLRVRDTINPSYRGKLIDWKIRFWGETSLDISQQPPQEQQLEQELDVPPESESEKQQENGGNENKVKIQQGSPEVDKTKDGEKTTTDPVPMTEETTKHESSDQHVPSPKSKQTEEASVDNLMEAIANPEGGSVTNALDEEVVASRAGNVLIVFGSVISIAGCAALLFFSKRRWDGRGRYASISSTDRDFGRGEADSFSLLLRTNTSDFASRQDMSEAPTRGEQRGPEQGRAKGGAMLSKVLRDTVGRISSQAMSGSGSRRDHHGQSARLARELLDPLESSPTRATEAVEGDNHGDGSLESEDDWMDGGR
ncbi:pheromone processing endoprotease [Actinomortierella wolfii]|nr:pheromone processing endoprotease [Actinomortierella wolfii]